MARRPSKQSVKLPETLDRGQVADMVLRTFGLIRWTQDSPLVPDVWIEYIRLEWEAALVRIAPGASGDTHPLVDLLITPWSGSIPGQIARAIRNYVNDRRSGLKLPPADVAPSTSRVATKVDFVEMAGAILPLTGWWQSWRKRLEERLVFLPNWDMSEKQLQRFQYDPRRLEWLRFEVLTGFVMLIREAKTPEDMALVLALIPRIGRPAPQLGSNGEADPPELDADQLGLLIDRFSKLLDSLAPPKDAKPEPADQQKQQRVWMVNLNRPASTSMFDARKTVKGDAAQRVFDTGGRGITVAVVDVGIDATHPGFLDRSNAEVKARTDKGEGFELDELSWSSRVRATYDFSLVRQLLADTANRTLKPADIDPSRTTLGRADIKKVLDHLAARAEAGSGVDWSLVEPLIRIPHDKNYDVTRISADHGTHVAGIIGANLLEPPEYDKPLLGICPEVSLYDMRVFDRDGLSDEYSILAAIEFIGWLNRNRKEPVVHAVNLSLGLAHDVDSFACGQTPICDACNQLVGTGTTVVASAGNTGFDGMDKLSLGTGYRSISITDPGNAEEVITVGSTHRRDPHLYGVSYFSSRGPTADGRRKPDMLAPGEKITSTVRDGQVKPLDGTSMAAPHVTGAAALMMARYPELIGHPREIKRVLMTSATDLGREPSFQGAGLLDILRAMQSV